MTTVTSPTLFDSNQQAAAPQPNQLRQVKWDTNINSKMDCTGFLHIDLPPQQKVPYSELQGARVRIFAKDESHAPIDVKLYDILQIELIKINSALTVASHGMDVPEFVDYICEKHKNIELTSLIAIYYYRKL